MSTAATATPGTDAAKNRTSNTLFWSGLGFVAGFLLVWGGCGQFRSLESQGIVACTFGGVIFALLGAVIGAVLGGSKKG